MRGLKVILLGLCVLSGAMTPGAPAFGQSSMRGPEGGACPTPVACDSCCPTPPAAPDLTCVNPVIRQHVNANVDLCLECSDALLRKAASCGPTDKCPLTEKDCPPGQYLWNPTSPDCKCMGEEILCDQLKDIYSVGVERWHSDTDPTEVKLGFLAGSEEIRGGDRLKASSPCMEKVRDRCAAMFITQFCDPKAPPAEYKLCADLGNGLQSYRSDSRFATLDTCISSALQVSLGATEMKHTGKQGAHNVFSVSGYLYADCSPVEPWKVKLLNDLKCPKVQTVFRELTSPVSLIWGSDVKIKDVISRSKFPLNPSEAGRWFVWRASGLTPLVVWDPEHKGDITKASQLFGNYTWDKKWKNGYEPLATLDSDNSGWLEGAELEKLSLWFDFNQDGISDNGEVRRLSDVGVTAIGVKSSYEDPSTHNIFADQGFKRIVNGQQIQGLSVDWFTGSSEERLGLEVLYPELPVVPAALAPANIADKDKLTSGIAGFWDWRAVDQSGAELPENLPSGSFIIYETDEGVRGSSFNTQRLAPNRSGMSEKVIRSVLQGEVVKRSDKKVQVTFSTTTLNGEKVETIAQLSDDKRTLRGITTEEQGPGQEKIQYGWIARRQSF